MLTLRHRAGRLLAARHRAGRLLAARQALAGLEFAIIVPVLLVMLCGTVDIAMAIMTGRRLTAAAGSIATIASTIAVQSSAVNTLTGVQAWQATTAAFALFPQWKVGALPGRFSITLSAVNFTAAPRGCSAACSYTAATGWSVGNTAGQVVLRTCGALAKAADGAATSMTTLPAGDFGATSLLVADVSTVFTPLFSSVFTGPLTLLRSAYISPRVNNGVQLVGSGAGRSVVCP